MQVFGWAQSWILNHFDLIGALVFPCVILIFVLPSVLVSMIGDRLPDAKTGFRRSDAIPIMPSAHFRSLAFLFGRRGLELSGPAGRWLIRLYRMATIVAYVSLFSMFIASVTEGYIFDPDADILKSDIQRGTEGGQQTSGDGSSAAAG